MYRELSTIDSPASVNRIMQNRLLPIFRALHVESRIEIDPNKRQPRLRRHWHDVGFPHQPLGA